MRRQFISRRIVGCRGIQIGLVDEQSGGLEKVYGGWDA
jgi:hypothetical protein